MKIVCVSCKPLTLKPTKPKHVADLACEHLQAEKNAVMKDNCLAHFCTVVSVIFFYYSLHPFYSIYKWYTCGFDQNFRESNYI